MVHKINLNECLKQSKCFTGINYRLIYADFLQEYLNFLNSRNKNNTYLHTCNITLKHYPFQNKFLIIIIACKCSSVKVLWFHRYRYVFV